MKLIIAEKPMLARAVAAAIDGTETKYRDYLEKGEYTIVSAFGHLLTLKEPEDYDARYGRWRTEDLPLYFDDWGKKPGPGKEERLALIGELLKRADCVIHAGDPDDEGQYLIDEILQWHDYRGPVLRLSTGDTTEGALRRALASMKSNDEFVNYGWSAHARSVADLMVGCNFSRYFSLRNPHVKLLTVGRVQTPTLGLVVMRDMAIENHSKLCYYTLKVDLDIDGTTVTAAYEPAKDDPNLDEGRITDADYAAELAKELEGTELTGIRVTRKQLSEQPPLPFNLVKLQTYCSNKFGYEPSQTLEITQTLRDNFNAITYNRSDCRYLSEEQYRESPATLRQVLGNLKEDPAGRVFAALPVDTTLHSKAFDDKNITAHTAIIPTNKRFDIKQLSPAQRNVYLAIAKYFFAQFLPPAEKERTALEAAAAGGTLRAASVKVLSPGYLTLIKPEKQDAGENEEEENSLSRLAPGTYSGRCTAVQADEKETKAPPRYTKASLNEDMTRIARYVTDPKAKALLLAKDKDKKGENGSIGTSATRSAIIDALETRGFIESKGKQIQSTRLGRELYRILPEELKKPDMTGLWWAEQQSIQEGTQPWTVLTDNVLEMVRKVLVTAYPMVDAYQIPESMRRGRLPLGACPRCGEPILEGTAGFGCSGYKQGCKFVIWKTAKSGMLSRVTVTPDMVHTWLSGEWTDEFRADESGSEVPTGKRRTVQTLPIKKLYSEAKHKTYAGQVYLTDDGGSAYGAGFGLAELIHEEPKPLGPCPRCGKPVVEGKNGYGCTGFREGCSFVVWKKAKSGMLSKQTITKSVVRMLLKSPWIPETEENEAGEQVPTGRLRSEKTVCLRRLFSTQKNKLFSGEVYLADAGQASQYG
ncbi:MAG: DNA topoisomerase, partial [Oscillospiraceae bacterium]|nr:DNA topoisomerase [Oscillospiraceae bacterium]